MKASRSIFEQVTWPSWIVSLDNYISSYISLQGTISRDCIVVGFHPLHMKLDNPAQTLVNSTILTFCWYHTVIMHAWSKMGWGLTPNVTGSKPRWSKWPDH